ncbi:MAG: exodeoxyribonuclease VII large subunit [Coriobacteriia bacterium]|nr:exodeoxyribonuclease VII large subunit [Coriobacteriia bacterium]
MSEYTDTKTAVSVSEALSIVKIGLETLRLRVIGEVSGFTGNRYPTRYFSLKDGDAVLKCVVWRNVYEAAAVDLKDGQEIEVVGKFSAYPARGELNFQVAKLYISGEGQLRMELAAREARLRAEGLFDAARKSMLPVYPLRIAVVTSPAGAVIHDITQTLQQRWPLAEILLYGVRVEGADAVAQIMAGLQAADASDAEVIILARGGGSFEDLLPFSDEALVRCIAGLNKPVVAGIGHEPDNSLADLVADVRVATPTAAAEAVSSPGIDTLTRLLASNSSSIHAAMRDQIQQRAERLAALASRPVFAGPAELLQVRSMMLDTAQQRLITCMTQGFVTQQQRVTHTHKRLQQAGASLLAPQRSKLEAVVGMLDALSPLKVLGRGYALVFDATDTRDVIDSVAAVTPGQGVQVRLQDGQLDCEVKGIVDEV